jgi:hypothetical protein
VGADFDVTLSVTNTGTVPLTGVGVRLHTDWGFEPIEQFSNCDCSGGRARLCTFDRTLEPGKSYRAVLPYKVRSDTYAPGGVFGEFEWLTADELSADNRSTPGVGGSFQLQEGDPLPADEDGPGEPAVPVQPSQRRQLPAHEWAGLWISAPAGCEVRPRTDG